jgi:F-type H+-transporting ATPase subunit a
MADAEHEDHEHSPLASAHLIGHVKDADYFELPRSLTPDGSGKVKIPQPLAIHSTTAPPPDAILEPFDLRITKFMVLEVIAAILVAVVFVRLANRMSRENQPRGRMWNLFESMLVFIRDKVARPAIGDHDADKFLPYLWTIFFFVLFCNLLGMVPWAGSATGALGTTLTLACITLGVVIVAGSAKMGPVGFWIGQVPHMDLPLPLAILLKPMIFVIEIMGMMIKHFILAMRLLANMMAGHLVLAVILAFIAASASSGLTAWMGVSAASVFGAVALSLLELFVAFLQAYIFTFLSALFIGMAVHPH